MTARNAGIDHIRILLTALVVLHHTAIAYGGAGGWYWRQEPDGSNLGLVAFNAINQSFFMGFFFLLAGYFSAASLGHKDSKAFLKERFKRLGLPLLAYLLILSPLTNALANANSPAEFWSTLLWFYRNVELEVGPLWFCEALLIFSVLLVVGRHIIGAGNNKIGSLFYRVPSLVLVALALGVINFGVRLVIPVGENVLWLQLAYFPCYIFLFYAGVAAREGRVLENLAARQAVPWIVIAFICIGAIPFALSGALGSDPFEGGMNWNALFYALWDPLVGLGIIVFLLWLFQTRFSKSTAVTAYVARRAYVVFITHPPVVVSYCLLLEGVAIAPIAKFFVVGIAAFVTCVLVGTLFLRVPAIRKVV